MVTTFETALKESQMAENTVTAYLYAVNDFYRKYKSLSKKNLLLYKTYLIEHFKPKTVNLRIQALNKFLEHIGKQKLRLKSVKVQQRTYLENVISQADYLFLKEQLRKEENPMWYFVVRFLAATGARPVPGTGPASCAAALATLLTAFSATATSYVSPLAVPV